MYIENRNIFFLKKDKIYASLMKHIAFLVFKCKFDTK